MTNRRHRIHITRDLVLLAAGLAGVLHETVWSAVDRPFLLGLFGAMIGLPVFLRLDAKRDDE